MSAPTATWAQAIEKVLQSSENEWLSPTNILREIKRQNLKEICSSVPICSIKKVLYRSNGPFMWDKINHVFALKSRLDDKVNETSPVEENGAHKAEETTNDVPIKNDKLSKEENKQSEGEENKHLEDTPQCYDTPCGYVVTVDPDNNNLIKHTNKSSSKLVPSPIRRAFPMRFLQSTPTKLTQSKPTKQAVHVAEDNNAVSVIEYDTLFDTTGDTCVAVLDKFRPRIVDPYEYNPSLLEESVQPEDSRDMEGSGEVDRSDRNVKKIPPSGPKLKRSAEKRKLSEDTNLASANIKSLLTMENFSKLSKDNKGKVVSLLPSIDQVDEYMPTSSAFTNTFFNSACRQWQQLLQSGQLSISQRAKQKLEETSRYKAVDEWKKQHFEEELSKDTPPQDPSSKLFYPVPLSAAHQRVLDCVNRACQAPQDTGTSSLPTTNTDDGEAVDQLLEQEHKPPNCGSPEQCNESHETNSGPLSESNHDDNKSELINGIENCKLSLELNDHLSEKNSKPDNGEILEVCEQKVSVTPKLNNEKFLEQSKKSPARLPVQNNKILGRSCEQVDQSHDQNCVTTVDKGKQVESESRLLGHSLEREFEKAPLSFKLQINKLCEQELYRQLELFKKSEQQQVSRLPEGILSVDLSNSCNDTNRHKKKISSCLKPPMNKFGPTSTTAETSGKESGINLCCINTPTFPNRLSQSPFSLFKTSPQLLGLGMPSNFEAGLKRKSPSTIPSMTKRVCNNARADHLTVLPASHMYKDVLSELKRSSLYTNKGHSLPKWVSKQPRMNWQPLHSIYHDHTYAMDYVPLSSTTSQEQMAASCNSCTAVPMLICKNCKRYFHQWCLVPGCSYCNECVYLFPLV